MVTMNYWNRWLKLQPQLKEQHRGVNENVQHAMPIENHVGFKGFFFPFIFHIFHRKTSRSILMTIHSWLKPE